MSNAEEALGHTEPFDVVQKPAHYSRGPVECVEGIASALGGIEFKGYVRGNMIKYPWREADKNGMEDIEKAVKYGQILMKYVEDNPNCFNLTVNDINNYLVIDDAVLSVLEQKIKEYKENK